MSNLKYRILFLSDSNGFDATDPIAWLVAVSEPVSKAMLDACSNSQLGARRSGGHLNHVLAELKALGINSETLYTGRKSDFGKNVAHAYSIYKLISGNY